MTRIFIFLLALAQAGMFAQKAHLAKKMPDIPTAGLSDTEKAHIVTRDNIGYILLKRLQVSDVAVLRYDLVYTKGIVIDLRTSASLEVPASLVSFFLSGDTLSADRNTIFASTDQPGKPDETGRFKRRVVLIVNENTQGAAVCLAIQLQASANTIVIGSETAGICEPSFSTIKPDILVFPTPEGIRRGDDELLAFAISLINHPSK